MSYTNHIKFLLSLAVGLPLLVGTEVHAQLALTVNQDTGEVQITNISETDTISYNGYQVSSQQNPNITDDGLLESTNWTTLAPAGGWLAANFPNSENVLETNADSSNSLAPGATQSLGNLYTISLTTIGAAQVFAGFGNEYRDLQFQYTDANNNSALVAGAVNYTGLTRENNLVLVVDTDGSVDLVNESAASVEIEAFLITSTAGSLDGAGWDGINPDIVPTWDVDTLGNTALATQSFPDPNAVGPLDPITIAGGSSFDLGSIFNGAAQDLAFDFLTTSDAEGAGTAGVVRYLGTPGDFDNDGDVDGSDFLAWQRGEVSSPPSANDLQMWQTNYGTGGAPLLGLAVVPEPSALVLSLLTILGLGCNRKL